MAASSPAADPGLVRRLGLFLLAWVPHALLVRHLWWLTDDAWISFRYARSWAQGHGPRFNLWEAPPVEGYSNFLWTALAALVEALGLSSPEVMPWVSAACATVLLWRVHARLWGHGALLATGVTLVLGLYPPFAAWATGGLATMPLALLTWLLFEAACLAPARPLRLALLVVPLVLLRTEGIAWALGLLGLGALLGPAASRGRLLPAAAVALLAWGLHRGWAWSWYGDWLASPTRAKSALSGHSLLTGLRYLGHHLLSWQALLLPLLAAPLALRRRRAEALPVALYAAAGLAWAVAVGGDWMLFGRFLVPAMAPLFLLLGLALVDLPRAAVGGVLAVGLALGLSPLAEVQLAPQAWRTALSVRWARDRAVTDLELWRRWQRRLPDRLAIARLLDRHLPPGSTLVHGGAGLLGYETRLDVYDQHGLVTREALLPEHSTPNEPPGHTVFAPNAWYLDRRPSVLDHAPVGGKNVATAIERKLREWRRWGAEADYVPVLLPLDGQVWSHVLVLERRDLAPGVDWQSWQAVLAGEAPASRPNIVLLVVDTLRADALGAYGQALPTSPELDAYAAAGVRFASVLAQAPWTRPSFGAMWTGLPPRSLGLYVEEGEVLADSYTTLAEALQDGGYTTLGVTANPNINSAYGFAQGFDAYQDSDHRFPWMPGGAEGDDDGAPMRSAPELFAALETMLDQHPQGPWFLTADLMEVHEHERKPGLRPEHATRFEGQPRGAYLRTVRQVSQDIDAFVQRLSQRPGFEHTVFVVTSDHGEGLDDHPSVRPSKNHGKLLYASQTQVPLLMWSTRGDLPRGRVVQTPARLMDLAPTLLDLAHLPPLPGIEGQSLLPRIEAEEAEAEAGFVVETRFRGARKLGLVTPQWRYLRHEDGHTGTAPVELQAEGQAQDGARTNRLAEEPEVARALEARLQAWEAAHPDVAPTLRDALSPAEEEELRALGYLE